jgi:hypothetical protein
MVGDGELKKVEYVFESEEAAKTNKNLIQKELKNIGSIYFTDEDGKVQKL